jgi:hypothetical protein
MAAELTGTNPVHLAVLGKARGITECAATELSVLLTVLISLWTLFNVLVALCGGVLAALLLHLVRRRDNGRAEHLELRARGWAGSRRYRLVEPDEQWVPLTRSSQR